MQYKEITCPSCSSLNVRKNGKTANQKQRYQCKDCRKQFITNYTYRGCQPEVRDLIVRMTMNSSGIRDIARVLLISPNTVLKHLRTASAQLHEPSVPPRIRDLGWDEFWSFVRTKTQQRWTWYAWDRQRKKIVASVNGRRTDKRCQQLLRKLSAVRVRTFHTDD